jgi:hypothetical protein
MDINTALLRVIESKHSSEVARGQSESGDVKQLQKLRTQLQNAGGRIQRDIAQYTELSQQTMQLTAIISDSVKKLPTGASNLLH